MRKDLSKNSTAVGGTAILEMDGALSVQDASVSKATPSIEPDFPSLLGFILRTALNVAFVHWFTNVSRATGGHVKFLHEYADCPLLLGNDGRPVALYEFIEAIDGAVDYDLLREEFPTVSFAQIHGAISFLRKVAQFNSAGVDIDEQEDLAAASDHNLIEALKKAIADQEVTRVLDHSERDR